MSEISEIKVEDLTPKEGIKYLNGRVEQLVAYFRFHGDVIGELDLDQVRQDSKRETKINEIINRLEKLETVVLKIWNHLEKQG